MYSVYAKKNNQTVCIYNDVYMTDETKALSPKLDLTESGAGTFSVKIPPVNNGYEFIERLITEIIVKKKDKEIWSGRVISSKEDFYKNKTLTCEGEFAYLNDTIQNQNGYDNMNVQTWFRTLIDEHNANAGSNKQFSLGTVTSDLNQTLTEPYTNYENTLKYINDVVTAYGGYLGLRKVNGVRYIDYISESNRPTSSQEIRFGSNLLDFTKSFDSTDFCTVILPLGERLDNSYGISMSGIDGVDAHVTVETITDSMSPYGSPYVINQDAVNIFGWICKKVEFDTNDEEELLDLAKEYLTETQFDTMVLEANAVDLSYLDVSAGEINLSEKVRVISRPHGMDTFLPVKKISIPLDNPANTTFTMGNDVSISLSSKSASASSSFNNYLNNTLGNGSLINIAKTNANQLINSFSTGYFTVTQKDNGSNEVYFSDTKISDGYDTENPMKEASSYWRWNLNGLAYYNKSGKAVGNPNYVDPTDGLRLALTKDGHIVGDYISAGVIQDQYDGKHFYMNFETGVVNMNVNSLNIQGVKAASTTDATNAANKAVTDLSGYSILNKIKNGNYLGLYYSNSNFYISASYIKTGILELGGVIDGVGQGGVLNVYNATLNSDRETYTTILTHKLSNDGLSSYGKNVTAAGIISGGYARNYTIKYGKAGYLSETSTGKRTDYYANYIGYYCNESSLTDPFAYIGLRGNNVANDGRLQTLKIVNKYSGIGISGGTSVTISGGSYNGNESGIELDAGQINFSANFSDEGSYTGAGYIQADGYHGTVRGTIYTDNIYASGGGNNKVTLWDNAYSWANAYNNNAVNYNTMYSTFSTEFDNRGTGNWWNLQYFGIDGNKYSAQITPKGLVNSVSQTSDGIGVTNDRGKNGWRFKNGICTTIGTTSFSTSGYNGYVRFMASTSNMAEFKVEDGLVTEVNYK